MWKDLFPDQTKYHTPTKGRNKASVRTALFKRKQLYKKMHESNSSEGNREPIARLNLEEYGAQGDDETDDVGAYCSPP